MYLRTLITFGLLSCSQEVFSHSFCEGFTYDLDIVEKYFKGQQCIKDDIFNACKDWQNEKGYSGTLAPDSGTCVLPTKIMPGRSVLRIGELGTGSTLSKKSTKQFKIKPDTTRTFSFKIDQNTKNFLSVKFESFPLKQRDNDICEVVPPSGWTCRGKSMFECSATVARKASDATYRIQYSVCEEALSASLIAADLCKLGLELKQSDLAKLIVCRLIGTRY